MKVLTANRLTDGECLWWGNGAWNETIEGADIAADKDAEATLDAIGREAFAANFVLDVAIIDIELADGAIRPLRLRERIRAAGPTVRNDLGKQARLLAA